MLTTVDKPILIFVFILAASVVWFAGIRLTQSTDVLLERFKIGKALGGMIFLAIVTDLPDVAITIGGSLHHQYSLVIGNLLGGVSLQTAVLVVLDLFGGNKQTLTSSLTSLVPVLECLLVIMLLIIPVMMGQLPHPLLKGPVNIGGISLITIWIIGLWLISKAPDWLEAQHNDQEKVTQTGKSKNSEEGKSLGHVIFLFSWSAGLTFLAGYALEESSAALAHQFGLSGMFFGATVLAAATALPELTTGLAAMKIGECELAVSDILGGNAFLPVLFPLGAMIAGQSILSDTGHGDIYVACLGILLTTVYGIGMLLKSKFKIFNMGIDSLVVLFLFVLGISILGFIGR